MESQHIFNGDMTRVARILVKVSAQYIAREANVTKEELRDFEKGRHDLSEKKQERVRAALEELGAEFLPDGPNGGYGIRLKFGRSRIYSLERCEGEGGPRLTTESDRRTQAHVPFSEPDSNLPFHLEDRTTASLRILVPLRLGRLWPSHLASAPGMEAWAR